MTTALRPLILSDCQPKGSRRQIRGYPWRPSLDVVVVRLVLTQTQRHLGDERLNWITSLALNTKSLTFFPILRNDFPNIKICDVKSALNTSSPSVWGVLCLLGSTPHFLNCGTFGAGKVVLEAQLTCPCLLATTNSDELVGVVRSFLKTAVTPNGLVTVDLVQPAKAFQKPREPQMDLTARGKVGSFNLRKKLVKLTSFKELVELFKGSSPVITRDNELPCERSKMLWAMKLCPELPSCLPGVLLEVLITVHTR